MPPVRITLPDGTVVTTGHGDLEQVLSRAFGRDVALEEARPGEGSLGATAEEYWPDMAGLDYRDTVTDFDMPAGTFFDIAVVHLLTAATIDHLRSLYPQGRFKARRFRPNIVVSTGPDDQGFAENDWIGHTATIGGNVRLAITAPCPLRHDHPAAGGPAQGPGNPPDGCPAQCGERRRVRLGAHSRKHQPR
jgi:hypothetical protein